MGSVSLELSKRPVDLLIVVFFVIHMPLMIFVDAQMILPRHWFPTFAQEMVDWHIENFGDFLMAEPPVYFKSIVWTEYFIQLPLHIANAYAFFLGKKWGRITGIIYGVHVATNMIPVLGDILTRDIPNRSSLLGIYGPYLLIPLLIVARVLPSSDPFGTPPAPAGPVLSSDEKKIT